MYILIILSINVGTVTKLCKMFYCVRIVLSSSVFSSLLSDLLDVSPIGVFSSNRLFISDFLVMF